MNDTCNSAIFGSKLNSRSKDASACGLLLPLAVDMDLFLVPDNPLRTVLVSPNQVAHYRTSTRKTHGRQVTMIERPAECESDSIVAEIAWRTHNWETATTVRLGNTNGGNCQWVPATDILYKRSKFSS